MIQRVDLGRDLQEVLQRDIRQQLLKESSATLEILTFYINLLKFWNRLGMNYSVLQSLTRPIKTYFLARPNALRCIIGSLTRSLDQGNRDGA